MMELFDQFMAMLRDLPGFLDGFITQHGVWVYVLLFAIIFAETGLVITPFLPGDSLLFTVGAIAAGPGRPFDPWGGVWAVSGLMIFAAILGDAVNYHIGKVIGPRIFRGESNVGFIGRCLNRKHLDRAHEFFEKYGGKAVILGRFVPIVRTFVPFVAGAGAMNYSKFFLYNVSGAFLWIGVCVGAGWFFGNIEWVKRNFEAVVIAIIVVSLLPIVIEFFIARRKKAAAAAATNT
jgi:membrane-associated protein